MKMIVETEVRKWGKSCFNSLRVSGNISLQYYNVTVFELNVCASVIFLACVNKSCFGESFKTLNDLPFLIMLSVPFSMTKWFMGIGEVDQVLITTSITEN